MRSLITAILFCIGAPLCAQTPSATIVGSIKDATGSVVPQAAIQVRNTATNEVRRASSAETGEFAVTNLAPGSYEVSVERSGFRRLQRSGIELQVAQVVRLDLAIELGEVTQTVEVSAHAPLLNTENAAKGEVITSREIAEMPLEGRDHSDLAYLVPGVARRAESGQGSTFAVNGARSDNTNFLVDGFNSENRRSGGLLTRPPLDSMQEFKMQTSGYSAEFGRLAGGVMNMALKTGGNQFHGTLFEYLRNDMLDARNFFSEAKSKLRRNQFGATATGPVLLPGAYKGRDRTFFLFSWESTRQRAGDVRLGRVPTELERVGDFSASMAAGGNRVYVKDPLATGTCSAQSQGGCFPGNRMPASRIHPFAAKTMGYYPLPNRPGQANNYLSASNAGTNANTLVVKVDHRLSAKDNLSVRMMRGGGNAEEPFRSSDLGMIFGNLVASNQLLAGLTHTRMFSSSLINEFRFGLTRQSQNEHSVNAGHDFAADFALPGTTKEPELLGFPRVVVTDYMVLGDAPERPIRFAVTNWQWADTLTWVRAKHMIKFGADIQKMQFFQPYYSTNNPRGTYNFLGRWTNDNFGDFLLGLPNSTSRQVGNAPNYMLSGSYGFFAQDDWRVLPQLTLNLGLRYELAMPPKDKYDRFTNFIPSLGKIVISDGRSVPDLGQRIADAGLNGKVTLADENGLPKSLIYPNYRNFAPRFGMAWRPGKLNKSVVRGGYGIFYGNTITEPMRRDLGSVYPFAISQTFSRHTTDPSVLTMTNPFPASRTSYSGVTNTAGYDLHAPAQYLQSWNLTVERELRWGSAIEIGYGGSKGTHLARRYDLNQPLRTLDARLPDGSFPKPFPAFNTILFYSFGSNSTFNSGSFTFRKRMTGGVFYTVSYTFSKSIDDASQVSSNTKGGYPGAQNARNLKGERGRSDWDTGHTMTMAFSYELPFRRNLLLQGWRLSGTGRAYTGQPLTPRTSNVDLNKGEADRPDRIAKGDLANPGPERWFDVTAFPLVPSGSYRFGNSGRNVLDGPGFVGLNFGLTRRFKFADRGSLEFRAESFNLTNHTNFRLPEVYVNALNGATITSAAPARTVQLSLNVRF